MNQNTKPTILFQHTKVQFSLSLSLSLSVYSKLGFCYVLLKTVRFD
ncbi:LOW QUALITY PROTEIN: hypothetical protein TorRG33x02_211060 [Trema orientale]|uniref:Uncharacterized protein n=1 Tax=Trema orientale TaxID=63057 RepID=A0A2P5EC59_TREOI|nr:LOW QUALITY PROTEIN: hypothetical protein TorRG33x02_211060 [Trema orientale]